MESDERFRISGGDCHDLADISGGGSRCSCDDRAGLRSPAGEIGAQLGHDTEGVIVSDIEGVGEIVAGAGDRRRSGAELWGGGIKGIFDSFFHSISVCVCVECSGCREAQSR